MDRAAAVLAAALLAVSFAATALPVDALAPAPFAVSLPGAAHDLARSGDGARVLVGTADGVVAFTPAGTQVFHALAGIDVRSVAADRRGDLVAAGDATGLVHLLRGDGSLLAVGLTLGAVNDVAVSADGSSVVAGSEDGSVYVFAPFDATPPPLPNLPGAVAAPVVLPQWSYDTQSPVTAVHVTADGRFVNAANGAASTAWQWTSQGALVPGGLVPTQPTACFPGPVGPNCWSFQMWSNGGLGVLAGARGTYDLAIGFGTGWSIATRASLFFDNPWSFKGLAAPTAGSFADTGSHYAVGDSLGNVHYVQANAVNPPHTKQALWHAKLGAEVTAIDLPAAGGRVAAGDRDGAVALYGPAGDLVWTHDAGARVVGLAFTPAGDRLAAAAGSTALFWS